MLERAKEIIAAIAKETDSNILMHSLSGTDSIALLDLVAPHFKRIVCVYMYVVPNLDHIAPFHRYAAKKYPNTEWMQVPHYGYYSWVKYGFMGVERNPNQRLWKLADIIDKVREKTGVEWACLGFKQSDSLNRRLMLRSYKDGKESISWKGKKFYPLSTYKNADVLEYISREHLKAPESYGGGGQSCGCDVSDYWYLKYLQQSYPDDLQKIYRLFPRTQFIIKEYEQEQARKQAEKAAREAAEAGRKAAEKAQRDTAERDAGDPAEPDKP